MSGPSAFQIEVAQLFFSLPASDGFLIAGGGALLAAGLTSRPTRDLDFFGELGLTNVNEAMVQFVAAANNRQWVCVVVQADDSFVRLHVKGTDEVLVDIAIDVGARYPSQNSVLGPTFNHEELAGRQCMSACHEAFPHELPFHRDAHAGVDHEPHTLCQVGTNSTKVAKPPAQKPCPHQVSTTDLEQKSIVLEVI